MHTSCRVRNRLPGKTDLAIYSCFICVNEIIMSVAVLSINKMDCSSCWHRPGWFPRPSHTYTILFACACMVAYICMHDLARSESFLKNCETAMYTYVYTYILCTCNNNCKAMNTVKLVYYRHLETNEKYYIVSWFSRSVYNDKAPFGTIIKCGLCRCPYFQVSWLTSFTV